MSRIEIQGKPEVDDDDRRFVVLAVAGAAKAVERLGGSLLRVGHRARQRSRGCAGLGRVQRVQRITDDWVVGQETVEALIGFARSSEVATARLETPPGIDNAQGGGVVIIGRLQASLRLGGVAQHVMDQPCVIIPEGGDRAIAAQALQCLDGACPLARAGEGPCGQQGRGDVGCPAASAATQPFARLLELAVLDGTDGQRHLRQPVGRITLEDALRRAEGIRHRAIGEEGDERALDQFLIARIGPQGLAQKCGGSAGIA